MSKYTTEVRYICEASLGRNESADFNSVEDIITQAAPNVFNFPFPIFDEQYRLPLEKKILRHYYTREICEETVGLWKLRLSARLNDIMPYYNKLYYSETLAFNPLYDVDYTREYTKQTAGETTDTETIRDGGTIADAKTGNDTLTDNVSDDVSKTGTESTASTGTVGDQGTHTNTETRNATDATTIGKDTWDLYSDTPQGGINGLLDNGQVESGTDLPNNTYLTNARHIMENGNAGSTSHTGTVGNSGSDSNTRTLNTTDTTTFNTDNDRTIQGTHQQAYNSTNTRTLNTTKTGNKSGTITNTDEFAEHIVGKTGGYTYSKALMEYRKALLNIDEMIINDLRDLFFNLW